MLEALPSASASTTSHRLGSPIAYAVCVVVTVFAILSQYFLPEAVPGLRPLYGNFLGDLFVVYGVPILIFAVLVGGRPLAGFADHMGRATVQGLAWYGTLSLLAIVVVIGLTIVYLFVDPAALNLLTKTTPVIQAAASDPWFWVAFSFVIGLVEEVIFRGWIFGYWLAKDPSRWVWHAGWTSALFAGVHLYYGQTYGAAAPLIFPSLFFLGFAFAATMRASGGNVLLVGILHGANDAIAFYSLLSNDQALELHYGIVLVGAAIPLALYIGTRRRNTAPTATYGPSPGTFSPANPYALFGPPGTWAPPPPPPHAFPGPPPPPLPPPPPPTS
ncbi:MAG: CPBP family intramembrane metalloprotease [Thermoplasmata archaeon]|nr:CPBP family intramembrane metalloprotease [Thermoplasmata archaeon]